MSKKEQHFSLKAQQRTEDTFLVTYSLTACPKLSVTVIWDLKGAFAEHVSQREHQERIRMLMYREQYWSILEQIYSSYVRFSLSNCIFVHNASMC